MVEQYGTDEQKEEYLRPVAENDQISGLAVSEPETGSDLAGMTTKAEKVDGGYELTGEKYWVGNAVEADWLTVYAKTGDSEDRYSTTRCSSSRPIRTATRRSISRRRWGCAPPNRPHRLRGLLRSGGERRRQRGRRLLRARGLLQPRSRDRRRPTGSGSPLPLSRRPRSSSTGATPSAAPSTSSRRSNTPSRDMRIGFESARALNWRACEKVADNDTRATGPRWRRPSRPRSPPTAPRGG